MCILLHGACARGEEPGRAWRVGEPIFTYCNFSIPHGIRATLSNSYSWPASYDPTTLTAAIAQQAMAGGYNLVWINDLSQLAIAERFGLRAQFIISGHQPQTDLFFLPEKNWPNPVNVPAINALIDEFKKSPAAYSYFIIDEPSTSRFPQLAAIVSYIKRRDPSHLAYINLYPPDIVTPKLGAANYAAHLTEFIRIVNPALLSYDSYNLFDNGDRGLFLGNLQVIAQAAAQARIPFMSIVQGSQFGSKWRLPTASELRFLTSAPLAFGAQGISYFNYWSPLGPSAGGIAPNPDGTPTTVYSTLRILSPQFTAIATRLGKLHWIGTYLKGYAASAMPGLMTQSPGNASFDVPGLANTMTYLDGAPLKGLLLGYFSSGCTAAACATHVFVQNLDYKAAKVYRVTGPDLLSVFDANGRTWIPTGHRYADITLEPGGGALIGKTSDVK
jgi:hypothetical protein